MKIKFSPKNALLIFSFRRENLWRMLSKILFLLSDLYCCYRLCLTNMFQYVMRILVQLFNFRRVFCIFNIFFFLYVTNISWNGKYRIIVSAGLYDKQLCTLKWNLIELELGFPKVLLKYYRGPGWKLTVPYQQ